MPIRSATSPTLDLIRPLLLGALLALAGGLAVPVHAQQEAVVELTLDQVRDLAVAALAQEDFGLAIQAARGLLQADPNDPFAHYVIATAHARLGQPREARKAAARAYRNFDTSADRFNAAQLAARMSYAEGNPTLAQLWLRRTAIHTTSERDEKLLAEDYKVLRRINPWSFRLRTDLRPSNNVNNGADTSLQIIDGVPVTGILSPTARALSGLIGMLDVSASYRLRMDDTSATSLAGRLFVQRVWLSSEARSQAPNARNSDFAFTYAEASLRHAFLIGSADSNQVGAVNLSFGESWYAQERSYRFGRASGEYTFKLGEETTITLHALLERRYKARFSSNDARVLGLGAEVGRKLGNGDRFTLSFAWRDTDAKFFNGTYQSASLRGDYTFDKRLGPAQLSAGFVLGYSDYPQFVTFLFAPGGRQDKSVYGDISLFFDRYDYAGFAPMLRFRSGRKSSNISRFDTRELSLSLSVESKF